MTTSSRRQVWLTRYLPLVLWIGVIFFLSSSQGSLSQTSRIIRPLLEFLFPSATPETLLVYHGIIRKFAHFAEYAVLALLAARSFYRLSDSTFKRLGAALLVVTAVAAIDEFQQSFNPARTGSPVDVLIDVTGGVAGVVVFYLLERVRRSAKPAGGKDPSSPD
jgi:VanZ family protein